MNIDENILRIVKIEPGVTCSDEYEDEIQRLQLAHNQQIGELCQEIDKSSRLVHQLKIEIDSMRILILQKDQQLIQQQRIEQENLKLKNDLHNLKTQYDLLATEMSDAREYMLNLIENFDN